MVSAAGVLTQWRDRSPSADHLTPTGSPAKSAAGIVFDGVNDRLDTSALSVAADQPLTIFAAVAFAGTGDGYIVDMSDNGSTARGPSLARSSGYLTARQGVIAGSGDAYLADASTEMRVVRGEYGTVHRQLWVDGAWGHANGLPTSTVRASAYMRVGARLDGAVLFSGTIAALVVYEGALTEAEAERVDAAIRDYMRVPDETYAFPRDTPVADVSGDPKLSMLPTLYGINGRPISIWRDSVHYRDGYAPQSLTGALAVDSSLPDRWIVIPASSGTYAMTLTEGAYEYDFNIVSRAALGGGDASKTILIVGDSNTNRGGSGWLQYLGDSLDAKATLVGTQGPAAGGYDYVHEGHDSYTLTTFSGASSPMWNGGAIDWDWYIGELSAAPDIIVWSFLPNSVDLTDPAGAVVLLEALIDGAVAELPSVKHLLLTPLPGNGDPAIFGGAASRNAFRTKINDGVRTMRTSFGGREAEGIYIANLTHAIDPVRGYVPDTIHHNNAPGGVQIAEAVYCALTGIWSL